MAKTLGFLAALALLASLNLVEGTGRVKCVSGNADANDLKGEFQKCLKFFDKNPGVATQCVRNVCGGFDKCKAFFLDEVQPADKPIIEACTAECEKYNKACKVHKKDKRGDSCKPLAKCVKTFADKLCKPITPPAGR